ncbi:ankyrin [Tupanvirus soda lake]|uniref:Ankyrin n=2 Tax=Tupanvirus TaxID=2094720 RepID=A0A6N1NIB5_9VIRU|nr:ankyrin [Tupanvirus soda lake]QKU34729.1 ankyrin [Tupanvirus soda lake]
MNEFIIRSTKHIDKICDFLDALKTKYTKRRFIIENDLPIIDLHVPYEISFQLIKFMIKNKIKHRMIDIEKYILKLIREKEFDNFSYLYKKCYVTDKSIACIIHDIALEYDIETISFMLSFNSDSYLLDIFSVVCARDDDNVHIVDMILNEILHATKNKKTGFSKYFDKINGQVVATHFSLDTPLKNAITMGNINIVKYLVDMKPSYICMSDSIELAIKKNHPDIAEYLLNHGAKLTYFDKTAFFQSIEKKEPLSDLIEFLCSHYKSNGKPLVDDKFLGDALVLACKIGNLDNVVAFVESGRDISKYKRKALIASKKHPNIIKYLRSLVEI